MYMSVIAQTVHTKKKEPRKTVSNKWPTKYSENPQILKIKFYKK